MSRAPSTEFVAAVQAAVDRASGAKDEAVAYMARHIPVYAQYDANMAQRQAAGCAGCVYRGLWAQTWPGYPPGAHGLIWLFEVGIRQMGGNLTEQCHQVLLHEMDHALQRDHVLDAIEQQKFVRARPSGGCGGCR